MFCPKCGKKNVDGAKFCSFCGAELPAAVVREPAPAADAAEESAAAAAPDAAAAAEASAEAAPAVDTQAETDAPSSDVLADSGAVPAAGTPSADSGVGSAAAAASAATGTRVVAPGDVHAPRKRSKLPVALAGIAVVAVAVIALAVFVLPGVFGSIFGGDSNDVDEQANAASLSYGLASSADGWDYFYCVTRQAIVRAKPGSELEDVLVVPDDPTLTYEAPKFYVTSIAADGDLVYYVAQSFNNTSPYTQLRCVSGDGKGDHLVLDLTNQSSDDGAYTMVRGLYAYDGRAYLVLNEGSYDADISTMRVVSIGASGEEEPRTECTLDDSYDSVIVTPEKIYYVQNTYNSSAQNYTSIYMANLDGSDTSRVFMGEGESVSDLALANGKIVGCFYNTVANAQNVRVIDPETGEDETLYAGRTDEWIRMLAVSDDTVYLENGTVEQYDITSWDLMTVPLSGGDATTLATDIDYYNPTAAVVNGHLLVLENGQDISSSGARAQARDLESGEVIEEYL